MRSAGFSAATTLDNAGTLIANAGATANGPFTTSATSILRLLPDNTTGFANFTSAGSFTNNGAIDCRA